MGLTGKLIYCFIKEKEHITFCMSTIAGAISPAYTVPYKDISAVVSDAELIDYDPTRKNITAFQRVISKVMEKYDIIPVAFGIVAQSKSDVENIIAANFDEFHKMLHYFEDKIEIGLRVVWNDSYFNEDIENDEIKTLKAQINGKDEDEVLREKVRLGRLVEASINTKREDYIKKICEPLFLLSCEHKLKEEIPIKTVFNAYFLIEKSKSDEFDNKVEELYQPYENKLNFSYTGPWPPYNFINLKLNPTKNEK